MHYMKTLIKDEKNRLSLRKQIFAGQKNAQYFNILSVKAV